MEEIRNVRAETANLKEFSEKEIKSIFDKKIEETIDKAIKEKTKSLLEQNKDESLRKNEQDIDISWALKSILARIERGMTVEIRFLPPAQEESAEEGQTTEPQEEPQEFVKLREIVPNLVFPSPDPNPVLQLPNPKKEDESKGKK
ncbi:MAG: hypothetical protein NPINA01_32350 [Nitrospinaceae bacterium]|nr:MAG: hypothetical protein NPINA01_32350 [Nitrospinaceae bacterium]